MSTRSLRHLRGALATVALATALAQVGAASADARVKPDQATATPGAGAAGCSHASPTVSFDAVIDRLRRDGYPVLAAPNPLVDLRSTPRPSAVSSTASRAPRSSSVTPTAAL